MVSVRQHVKFCEMTVLEGIHVSENLTSEVSKM